MIVGWDLGGAHVKVAVLDESGRLLRIAQTACPLWLGLDHLERALRELSASDASPAHHAITMTGELVDLFPDRASGVKGILSTFERVIGIADSFVFAGDRFVGAEAARAQWAEVASANWRASAQLLAALAPDALMIDIGSTTADVVLIADGRVQAQGRDDRERLAREELVYTGVVRTPLATVADTVPFAGEWVGVTAEHFATTGDLYRISGELDPRFDQAATADGRDRSPLASMRRLARMIGCDVEAAPAAEWAQLARWFSHAQVERIRRACDRALSRGLIGADAPFVGLGVGHFLAERLAAAMHRPYIEFAALLDAPQSERGAVNACGPAYAVAELRRRL